MTGLSDDVMGWQEQAPAPWGDAGMVPGPLGGGGGADGGTLSRERSVERVCVEDTPVSPDVKAALLHACMLSRFSHVQLYVTPWTTYSPRGSSAHGIIQARILEQVAMPSSRGSSRLGDRIHLFSVSCIGRPQAGSLPLVPPGKQPLGWILILGLRLQSLWTSGSLQGRMYHLRDCGHQLGGL